MTTSKMSSKTSLDRVNSRAHFLRLFNRALAIKHAQFLRERKRRLQSGQLSEFLKPRMDIWDSPDSPSITATLELPGLKKEEISLLIQDGSLVIWGERRSRLAPSGTISSDKFPVQEVKYGKFRRVIPLPHGAQTSEISASITDGMLTIAWPRNPATFTNPLVVPA